jgi:hypothetical protein
MEMLTTLTTILQTAGGYGIAAIGFWLFFKERTYSQTLNAKILEQGIKSVEATMAVNNTLLGLRELFRDILDKKE